MARLTITNSAGLLTNEAGSGMLTESRYHVNTMSILGVKVRPAWVARGISTISW